MASVIIWALGYFPRTSENTEAFNKEISQKENTYQKAIRNTNITDEEKSQIENQYRLEKGDLIYKMESNRQENSYIGRLGKLVEPVMRPLGFDWKMSVSLLAGVAAKEVVVSTMGVLYQADGDPDKISETLVNNLRSASHTSGENIGKPIFNTVNALDRKSVV